MQKRQSGFTLIELVVVITILGILAAFALPRFAELQTRARIAAMNGALASIKSAAVLAHSVMLTENISLSGTQNITMEGVTVPMNNGYPAASLAGIGVAAGLVDSNNPTVVLQGYDVPTPVNGVLTVRPDASHVNCQITYTESVGGGQPPIYNSTNLTTTNCG